MNTYGYPQQLPQQYYRYQVPQGLKGRPVSGLEEARASGIDFDGSIFYFPDIANKRIYTKQINLDGTASLNVYELIAAPQSPQPDPYVSRDEFTQRMDMLLNEINQMKGEKRNEQQPINDVTELHF